MKSNLACFSYYHNGKINLQFENTNDALRIAEESGDIYSKAMAYVTHGISCYAKRLLEDAEKYLLKGLEFCERMNFPAWDGAAQFFLGEKYFLNGSFQRSKEH